MLEMFRRDQFRQDLLVERCEELVAVDDRLRELDTLLAVTTSARRAAPAARCECGAPFCGARTFARIADGRRAEHVQWSRAGTVGLRSPRRRGSARFAAMRSRSINSPRPPPSSRGPSFSRRCRLRRSTAGKSERAGEAPTCPQCGAPARRGPGVLPRVRPQAATGARRPWHARRRWRSRFGRYPGDWVWPVPPRARRRGRRAVAAIVLGDAGAGNETIVRDPGGPPHSPTTSPVTTTVALPMSRPARRPALRRPRRNRLLRRRAACNGCADELAREPDWVHRDPRVRSAELGAVAGSRAGPGGLRAGLPAGGGPGLAAAIRACIPATTSCSAGSTRLSRRPREARETASPRASGAPTRRRSPADRLTQGNDSPDFVTPPRTL
jgi:hypothetical protein